MCPETANCESIKLLRQDAKNRTCPDGSTTQLANQLSWNITAPTAEGIESTEIKA